MSAGDRGKEPPGGLAAALFELDPRRPREVLSSLLTGPQFRELRVFFLVGLSNTVVGYVIYLGFLLILPYLWAFTCSFVTGLVYSAVMNIRVTFSRRLSPLSFSAFTAYYIFYYVVSVAFLKVTVGGLGIDARIAPLLMLPVMVPINFVCSRAIIHRFSGAHHDQG